MSLGLATGGMYGGGSGGMDTVKVVKLVGVLKLVRLVGVLKQEV